jgi:hypothetical protein
MARTPRPEQLGFNRVEKSAHAERLRRRKARQEREAARDDASIDEEGEGPLARILRRRKEGGDPCQS